METELSPTQIQEFRITENPPIPDSEKERHDEYASQLQYMMDSGLPLPPGAEEYLKTNYGFK